MTNEMHHPQEEIIKSQEEGWQEKLAKRRIHSKICKMRGGRDVHHQEGAKRPILMEGMEPSQSLSYKY